MKKPRAEKAAYHRRVTRFVLPRAAGAALGFLIFGAIAALAVGAMILTQCQGS